RDASLRDAGGTTGVARVHEGDREVEESGPAPAEGIGDDDRGEHPGGLAAGEEQRRQRPRADHYCNDFEVGDEVAISEQSEEEAYDDTAAARDRRVRPRGG